MELCECEANGCKIALCETDEGWDMKRIGRYK